MIFKTTSITAFISFVIICFIPVSCTQEQEKTDIATKGFQKMESVYTGIKFQNKFIETPQFNFISYPYIYGGAGVAVGDINNDGLTDIYLISNYGSDRLFLNNGAFKFTDITANAGLSSSSGWSTGVSMADVNGDGWLDIYVSRSGPMPDPNLRRNLLFINKQNGTFEESAAQWGLDFEGYSNQAYFFDYDKDGDLDMYQLNHRIDFKNSTVLSNRIKSNVEYESSDQLFENKGNRFVNVTEQAKITNKAWGLSCSIGDFNNDSWPDIYVCNDYLDPDILYINQGNGQFKDEIQNRFAHTSFYSMGSDYSDINNDGQNDLMVLDMLAEDHKRNKENMASMSTDNFWQMVNNGYNYQYMSNMLQLNLGNGTYTDIGQMAGIAKTDWSWSPLAIDFNNDGLKDIFVSNGIYKDVTNRDANITLKQLEAKKQSLSLDSIIALLPSQKQKNHLYINQGDLTFKNKAYELGLGQASFTSGAAYADLDNDGNLDLILNNTSDETGIYRNLNDGNHLTISLKGANKNTFGVGAKVEIYHGDKYQSIDNYPVKGYLSSVDPRIHFGLGQSKKVDKIVVTWINGRQSILEDQDANQLVEIQELNTQIAQKNEAEAESNIFTTANAADYGLDFLHKETFYDDYGDQLLLPQKKSNLGPCSATADVNNDGRTDLFIGGAAGQAPALYIQGENGMFTSVQEALFALDNTYEDQTSLFLDIDQDGDQDIVVGSGSYEFKEGSNQQLDRFYINDGQGQFLTSKPIGDIKTNTKVIKPIDFDNDGDFDLIIGANVLSSKYPFAPKSYILENRSGEFFDLTDKIAPEWSAAGMIYDIAVLDQDNDGDLDFIAAGEWMPLIYFENKNGQFLKTDISTFGEQSGWWYSLHTADIDNDGDLDLLAGNLGKNNKFNPKENNAFHIYCNDYDNNGSYDIVLSKESDGMFLPVRGRECSSQQVPDIATNFETYKAFSSADIVGIYGKEKVDKSKHLEVQSFETALFINSGQGEFKKAKLPSITQTGPTLDALIQDFNKDGHLDILGIGAIHQAEIETIRYDGNRGYLLLGDGKGNFSSVLNSGINLRTNARSIETISIEGEDFIVVSNNHNYLSLRKINH
jgi:hypothetical protein